MDRLIEVCADRRWKRALVVVTSPVWFMAVVPVVLLLFLLEFIWTESIGRMLLWVRDGWGDDKGGGHV